MIVNDDELKQFHMPISVLNQLLTMMKSFGLSTLAVINSFSFRYLIHDREVQAYEVYMFDTMMYLIKTCV